MPANLENSSGHRTGKGLFSFQSQRKAMTKSAQTTIQLDSSHMLVKWCLKFSKPGFSNTWTVNFQMFKLVSEKAEDQEIKLPASTGSSKKQESSRKTSISALLTMPKPLTVWNSQDGYIWEGNSMTVKDVSQYSCKCWANDQVQLVQTIQEANSSKLHRPRRSLYFRSAEMLAGRVNVV